MKRAMLFLSCFALCLSMAACGTKGDDTDKKTDGSTSSSTTSTNGASGTSYRRDFQYGYGYDSGEGFGVMDSVGNTIDRTVDSAGNAVDRTVDSIGNAVDRTAAKQSSSGYTQRLQTSRVHDTDGILTDGENTVLSRS